MFYPCLVLTVHLNWCAVFYLSLNMATIDDVYSLTKYRANKSGYSGTISPNDFNLLFPRASIRYYNKEYARYASTKIVGDSLSRFISLPTAITIDSNGQYTFPADMFHVVALTHNYNGAQVEITEVYGDRLANNLSSDYDAPNEEFPIYTQYEAALQFYPTNLGTANLIYLKRPVKAVWGYTLVSGRPVYNPATSVDPEWNDIDIDNIIFMVLSDIGINIRDQELEAFAITQSKLNV